MAGLHELVKTRKRLNQEIRDEALRLLSEAGLRYYGDCGENLIQWLSNDNEHLLAHLREHSEYVPGQKVRLIFDGSGWWNTSGLVDMRQINTVIVTERNVLFFTSTLEGVRFGNMPTVSLKVLAISEIFSLETERGILADKKFSTTENGDNIKIHTLGILCMDDWQKVLDFATKKCDELSRQPKENTMDFITFCEKIGACNCDEEYLMFTPDYYDTSLRFRFDSGTVYIPFDCLKNLSASQNGTAIVVSFDIAYTYTAKS